MTLLLVFIAGLIVGIVLTDAFHGPRKSGWKPDSLVKKGGVNTGSSEHRPDAIIHGQGVRAYGRNEKPTGERPQPPSAPPAPPARKALLVHVISESPDGGIHRIVHPHPDLVAAAKEILYPDAL